ncbi:MAG: family 1 glycosylhydrolase, partial [Actinobacteria bacterium]|nr:family 1 glycosylhydrolase [Actinomycetota bacterium]
PVDLAPLLEEVVAPGDLAVIRQPLDFYGVNYYQPFKIGAAPEDAEMPFQMLELLGYPVTGFGWPVVPDALREWLIMFRARFRAALPPIVITESGCSYADEPGVDGVVDDQQRIDYLNAHLHAVAEAAQRGVDVRGYYAWSLLDNWEWTEGFTQRFGLVHVDFATGERTPKKSFGWYRDLVATQPRSLG